MSKNKQNNTAPPKGHTAYKPDASSADQENDIPAQYNPTHHVLLSIELDTQ